MKTKTNVIIVILMLLLTIPAAAAQSRSVAVMPSISFNGTTATCSASIYGDYATDEIEAKVELWQGNTLIRYWTDSGTASVVTSRTISVTKGKSYTLRCYATVNDTEYPMAYITRTCP